MSFKQLKEDELRLLAEEGFAVTLPEKANKNQIIAALVESTITWEQALQSPFMPERFQPQEVVPVKPEPEVAVAAVPAPGVVTTASLSPGEYVVPATAVVEAPKSVVAKVSVPEKVLLRMTRENPRYDIRGHKFTTEHPFALVGEEDAEYIVENVEGFRYATPKEAKEFYA